MRALVVTPGRADRLELRHTPQAFSHFPLVTSALALDGSASPHTAATVSG